MARSNRDPEALQIAAMKALEARRKKLEPSIGAFAREVAQKLSWVAESEITQRIRNLVGMYNSRTSSIGSIGTSQEAREHLERLTNAAEELRNAIQSLGSGAHAVLQRPIDDQRLWWSARPHELGGDLVLVGPDQESVDVWKRGGRWCIQLEDLSALAVLGLDWMKQTVPGGRHHGLRETLRGSAQETLFYDCAESLGRWLLAPGYPSPDGRLFFDMERFDALLLRMGQRIHEIAAGEKLSVQRRQGLPPKKPQRSQWGRAAARKAKERMFGTAPKKASLKNNLTT